MEEGGSVARAFLRKATKEDVLDWKKAAFSANLNLRPRAISTWYRESMTEKDFSSLRSVLRLNKPGRKRSKRIDRCSRY